MSKEVLGVIAVVLLLLLTVVPALLNRLELKAGAHEIMGRFRPLLDYFQEMEKKRTMWGDRAPFDYAGVAKLLKRLEDRLFDLRNPFWIDGHDPDSDNFDRLCGSVHTLQRHVADFRREMGVKLIRIRLIGFRQIESLTGPVDCHGRRPFHVWAQLAEMRAGYVVRDWGNFNPDMLPSFIRMRAGEEFWCVEVDGVRSGFLPMAKEDRETPVMYMPPPPVPTPPMPPRTPPSPPKLTVVKKHEPKLSRAERKRRRHGGNGGRNEAIAA